MYVGNPTHKPLGPFCLRVTANAWKIFLYGRVPSAFGFYAYNFVFALSNGRLIVEAQTPAIVLAKNPAKIKLFGKAAESLSFDSSYVENIAKLSAIALVIVGTPPFQRLVTPSSAGILLAASKKPL